MPSPRLLTIADAAKVSGLSPAMLRRLDDRLKPVRSPGGFRLYEFDAVMDYVARRKRGGRRWPWIDQVFCRSSSAMPQIPDGSVDLIVTSPPYAGRRGGVDPDRYVEWFRPFAAECRQVMKRRANFVLVIKEGAIGGVRHQYVHELVRDLTSDGFDWIDEYVWSKPCPLPKKPHDSLKDGWERCHVFGVKGVHDRMFFPDQVRQPLRPHHNTVPRARTTAGGFTFGAGSFTDLDGAYPSNVLHVPNANDGYRFKGGAFPVALADFFIRLYTPDSQAAIVLDPFCGSGSTLVAALSAGRHYCGIDNSRTAYHITMARLTEAREQLGRSNGSEDASLAEAVGRIGVPPRWGTKVSRTSDDSPESRSHRCRQPMRSVVPGVSRSVSPRCASCPRARARPSESPSSSSTSGPSSSAAAARSSTPGWSARSLSTSARVARTCAAGRGSHSSRSTSSLGSAKHTTS